MIGISSSPEEAYVTAKGMGDLNALEGSVKKYSNDDDLLSFGLNESHLHGESSTIEEAYETTKGIADLNVVENMPKPGQDYMDDGKSKYFDMYV